MTTARLDPAAYESLDDYAAALSRLEWLTPAEYAAVLEWSLAYGEESHAETVTQYRSECAMFGDAGPGQGLAVREGARMLAQDRAKLARVRRIVANLAA